MRRLFRFVRFTLKLWVYTLQALLGAWEQFTYELEQDRDPKIPIRNQTDALKIMESLRQESVTRVAEELASTAGTPDEFDDHAPTIGGGSVLDAYAKRSSRDPVSPPMGDN